MSLEMHFRAEQGAHLRSVQEAVDTVNYARDLSQNHWKYNIHKVPPLGPLFSPPTDPVKITLEPEKLFKEEFEEEVESVWGYHTEKIVIEKKELSNKALFLSLSIYHVLYVARRSKFFGYIPLLSTAIGIYRMVLSRRDYLFFKKEGIISLQARSVKWMVRGALESIPGLNLSCLVIDIGVWVYRRIQSSSHTLQTA